MLPGGALGGAISAGLRVNRSELRLRGGLWPTKTIRHARHRLTISSWELAFLGGASAGRGRVRFPVALGLALGRQRSDGGASAPELTSRQWWAGIVGQLGGRVHMHKNVTLELALEGLFTINRPEYALLDADGPGRTVHEQPWLSLRSWLGLGVDFDLGRR